MVLQQFLEVSLISVWAMSRVNSWPAAWCITGRIHIEVPCNQSSTPLWRRPKPLIQQIPQFSALADQCLDLAIFREVHAPRVPGNLIHAHDIDGNLHLYTYM